jgi:hypothetical protein
MNLHCPSTVRALRDYRGAFEVHLTVSAPEAGARERFRQWCAGRESKYVWIVLARGAHADQPMATWRRGRTALPAVLADANRRAAELDALGLDVTRVKIEAAPFNEELPTRDADTLDHPRENYFEHHVKLLRAASAPREGLLRMCDTFGAHLSRNAFRDSAGGREERFVTLRSYGVGSRCSVQQFRQLLAALRESGEHVLDAESEYCVYDSAVELDAGWLQLPD